MTKRILFQGDSITDCGRSREWDLPPVNCNQLGTGYPYLVAADLWGRCPGGYEVLNRGISGNRVVDLYARWKIDCINLKPDVLSILIGVNDSWHELGSQNGVEIPRYERIYRELLQWVRETLPETELILIEPFTGSTEIAVQMKAEVRERASVTKKLADEFQAKFLPAQELFDNAARKAPMDYWIGDGVHPTPAGHRLLADAWEKLMGL